MPLSIHHTEDQLAAAAGQGNHTAAVRCILNHLLSRGHRPNLRDCIDLYRIYQKDPGAGTACIDTWKPATPQHD